MAQKGALLVIAKAKGLAPEVFIPETINRLGTLQAAAKELGVNRQTLRNWIDRNGYEVERLNADYLRVVKSP